MHLPVQVLDLSYLIGRQVQLFEGDAVLEASDLLNFVAIKMQFFQKVTAGRQSDNQDDKLQKVLTCPGFGSA